jgi:hypothetical protein
MHWLTPINLIRCLMTSRKSFHDARETYKTQRNASQIIVRAIGFRADRPNVQLWRIALCVSLCFSMTAHCLASEDHDIFHDALHIEPLRLLRFSVHHSARGTGFF